MTTTSKCIKKFKRKKKKGKERHQKMQFSIFLENCLSEKEKEQQSSTKREKKRNSFYTHRQ